MPSSVSGLPQDDCAKHYCLDTDIRTDPVTYT